MRKMKKEMHRFKKRSGRVETPEKKVEQTLGRPAYKENAKSKKNKSSTSI